MNHEIAFLGAGKMAEGILCTIKNKRRVIMAEKCKERSALISKAYKVKVVSSAAEAAADAKYVFLAVRPQDVEALSAEVKAVLKKGQVLVSIVAGKSVARLRKLFGSKVKIIRVMPNLALRAKAGMCALTAHDETVESILGAAGETIVLNEKYFDVVTALSGSGPAYFAFMQYAMAKGAMELGLPEKAALFLSKQTMYGTAKFLKENDGIELEKFIAGVCTKGGTTAAGMKFLDVPQFVKSVARTLCAAAERSKELNA